MLKTLAMTALAAVALTTPARADDDVTLALPALNMGFAAAYVADHEGYWKKSGLNVRIVEITGIGAMNAVLAKSADFTISSGLTLIRANARGQKVIQVAHTYDGLIEELVVSKKLATEAGITIASPIEKRAAAIKGKKIAIGGANALPHGYLRLFAKKGGIDPEKDIQVAIMQPDASAAALRSGQIDGFVETLPQPLSAVHDGSGVLISSGLRGGKDDRGDFPEFVPLALNGVMTRPDMCETKETVCARFVAGIVEAMAYMRAHKPQSIALLQKRIQGMNPDVFAQAFELTVKWMPPTAASDDARFAKSQELSIVAGMIKPEEKLASFKAIYTNKYVK